MKVSELKGIDLDFWVAKAAGLEPEVHHSAVWVRQDHGQEILWCPSKDWSLGGPIIEREWLSLIWTGIHHTGNGEHCSIKRGTDAVGHGNSPLEAAMRAFVMSRFGKEVPDFHHTIPAQEPALR